MIIDLLGSVTILAHASWDGAAPEAPAAALWMLLLTGLFAGAAHVWTGPDHLALQRGRDVKAIVGAVPV